MSLSDVSTEQCARQPEVASLTPREQSLLELLKQGMSNKEIARTLGTSDLTVKKQMLYLFQKLGVHSRLEAVVQVMQAEINELREELEQRDKNSAQRCCAKKDLRCSVCGATWESRVFVTRLKDGKCYCNRHMPVPGGGHEWRIDRAGASDAQY